MKTESTNTAAPPPSTRELILDAAEDLFATQGYTATTIKEVAAQVGVQGPALYKHFANKRALFEEVLARLFSPFTELIADGDDLQEEQMNMVRQHLANPNASRIVQHATLSGGEDLALLVERWYVPFFQQAQAGLDKDQKASGAVAIMAFHSMLLGYLTLAPLHREIFDIDPLSEESIRELLELEGSMARALIS